MKTIELTLFVLGTAGVYMAYVYYLFSLGADPKPTNLWFGIGAGLDEFLFNSGVKPKQAIQNAPNRVSGLIN